MTPVFPAIPTPCIGVCMLDAERYCMGCHRSADEIARWIRMDERERRELMLTTLPARAALRE